MNYQTLYDPFIARCREGLAQNNLIFINMTHDWGKQLYRLLGLNYGFVEVLDDAKFEKDLDESRKTRQFVR